LASQILPQIYDKSLAVQIYEFIRRQIGSGELRPGERILEGKFTREFGISRTPVREALLRLERDGLVVCNSRRSYNVRRLTVRDVKQIYVTLGILESAAAGLAVQALLPEDIRLLKETNQEMERTASDGDRSVFGDINHKFHDVFLARLDNHIMREVCDSLRALLYVFPAHGNLVTETLKKSIREHWDIISLAEAGDGKALESYFRDIHWSSEKNLRYIEEAYDLNGNAVLPPA
jgi:DNA-binding GntR family transcriptional regulator